jgi:hypothetical protein
MKIDPKRHQSAIYCASGYGPTFGGGGRIKNNPNTTMASYFLIWIWVLIHILNMKKEQSKQEHFWLAHMNFNWTKLKSMKKI